MIMKNYKAVALLTVLLSISTEICRAEDSHNTTSPNKPELENSPHRIGNLRRTIPGEPNVDYPIFHKPPESSFNCTGRRDGYYADIEARCQVFRVCANTDLTGKGFPFLCPNGTLFNQKFQVCDWYNKVDCSASEQYYHRNDRKELLDPDQMMVQVKEMIKYPINTKPTTINTPTPTVKVSPTAQSTPTSSITRGPSSDLNLIQPVIPYNRGPGTSLVKVKPLVNSEKVFPANPSPTTGSTPTSVEELNTNTKAALSTNTATSAAPTDPPTTAKQLPVKDSPTVKQLPETVYVSSLGELSTDVNSGFDINNSRFLITSQEVDKQKIAVAAPKKQLLQALLDEQVSIIGQTVNNNGLQAAAPLPGGFLPRIISSNIIVPLPKGFTQHRKKKSATKKQPASVVSVSGFASSPAPFSLTH